MKKLYSLAVVPMALLAMCGAPKPPLAQWVKEAVNTVPGAELKLKDGAWYVYYTHRSSQYEFDKCFGYLYDTYWYRWDVRNGKGAYVCSGEVPGVGKYVGDILD